MALLNWPIEDTWYLKDHKLSGDILMPLLGTQYNEILIMDRQYLIY